MWIGRRERTLISTSSKDILTHVLRQAVPPGTTLELRHEDLPKFAEGIIELLGRFGWFLEYDPCSLQNTIDRLVAGMPRPSEGEPPQSPELHRE